MIDLLILEGSNVEMSGGKILQPERYWLYILTCLATVDQLPFACPHLLLILFISPVQALSFADTILPSTRASTP